MNLILNRVDKLQKAVIQAREEANGRDVQQKQVADALFSYLFVD